MGFTFKSAKDFGLRTSQIIGLSGLSGSGKTYSALLLAKELAADKGGPVLGICTENGRMAEYKDYPEITPFDMTTMDAPYSSQRYMEAVATADKLGAGCIVLDSGSDEWESEGGVLDFQKKTAEQMAGDNASYTRIEAMTLPSWTVAKPPHKAFANALFKLNAHIIICFRAEPKTGIIDNPERPNKKIIVDKGLQPIVGKAIPFKLKFHLLMTENGDGLYTVLRVNRKDRHIFPPDGRVDVESARRLIASIDQPPQVAGKPPERKPAERKPAPGPSAEPSDIVESESPNTAMPIKWSMISDGTMQYEPSRPWESSDKSALRELFKVLKHDIQTAPVHTAIKIARSNITWMAEMGKDAHAALNEIVATRRKEIDNPY